MKFTQLALLLLAVSPISCLAPGTQDRWERHRVSEYWSRGFLQQFDDPGQYVAGGFLLAAVPFYFANDDRIFDSLYKPVQDPGGDLNLLAQSASPILGATALGWGVAQWAGGDEGRSVEVLAESVLLSQGLVAILKVAVDRERPRVASTSGSSFPSGHTAAAFSSATYLARSIRDATDGPLSGLGYLAYAPAIVIGANRVKTGKHHPSDVAVGALIGTVLTNWIYNAHYGGEQEGIFGNWRLAPEVHENGVSLGFSYRF